MRILSVGVAVIDFVFHVKHFPTRAEKYRADAAAMTGGGGGANAAVAIARLGGRAELAARIGDDMLASLIEDDLVREGVGTGLVRRFPERRSSFSSVLVDAAAERQIVNFRDTGLSFDGAWLRAAIEDEVFVATLADTRWPEGAAVAMARGHALGVPAVMDAEAPIEGCEDALRDASHVVFSAQGLRDFAGVDPDGEELERLLRWADGELPGLVGVTDGADGVRWIEDGVLHHRLPPALPAPVTDTLGAGDVWHGAFALALGEGAALDGAMAFANAAASLKCIGGTGREGIPDRAAVEALLATQGFEGR